MKHKNWIYILLLGLNVFFQPTFAAEAEDSNAFLETSVSNKIYISTKDYSIDLSSETLEPSSADPGFHNDLRKVVIWLQENITDLEKLPVVLSTIRTFSFLAYYKDALSNIFEAKSSVIVEKFRTIWETREKLPVPEVPEVEGEDVSQTQIDFQKINRYLFEDYDAALERIFAEHRQHNLEFATPVVEWTSNIIFFETELLGRFLNEDDNLCPIKLENYIQENYLPENLIIHLLTGWSTLVKRIKELTNIERSNSSAYKQKTAKLLNALRCTMCYPARASII